jgi:hypothetical protein
MSAPLGLVRDDEERLSAPAFQPAPSSRVLSFSPAHVRSRMEKLAHLDATNPRGARMVDFMIDKLLNDAT